MLLVVRPGALVSSFLIFLLLVVGSGRMFLEFDGFSVAMADHEVLIAVFC